MNNFEKIKEYEAHKEQVPSYEEYLSLTYAKEEDEGIIAEYETENTKLKELLKRVNEHFKWVNWDDNFYENDELWDDIKKALGEE